jgi:hypothetical protein
VLCADEARRAGAAASESVPADVAAGTAAEAAALRGALAVLLASSAHPLAAPAEIAVAGCLGVVSALPPAPPRAHVWRSELFAAVAQGAVVRSSRAHLRRGTGEDLEDLHQWRDVCAAPLLACCCETLGIGDYLAPLAHALRTALHDATSVAAATASQLAPPTSATMGGGAAGVGVSVLEKIEALLFAAACTSGRCVYGRPADDEQVTAVEGLAAAAVAMASTAGGAYIEVAAAVVRQAAACREALDRVTSDDFDEPRGGLGWASLT